MKAVSRSPNMLSASPIAGPGEPPRSPRKPADGSAARPATVTGPGSPKKRRRRKKAAPEAKAAARAGVEHAKLMRLYESTVYRYAATVREIGKMNG